MHTIAISFCLQVYKMNKKVIISTKNFLYLDTRFISLPSILLLYKTFCGYNHFFILLFHVVGENKLSIK